MLGNILGAIVLGIIGIALLTNGYRWFRILLPFWAFFAGASFVTALVTGIFGQNIFSTAIACVPAVLLGLLFALLSFVWWSLAVLFWAGSVGAALFAGLLSALGVNAWLLLFLAGVIGAIVFITLAMRADLRRYLPIFLTACAGATMILTAILLLLGRPVEELGWGTIYGPLSSGASGSFLSILIWLVLAGVGMGIQSARNNRSLEVDLAQYQLS